MSDFTPVFIFSLPRSGSTLLQRMLATHPMVDTVPEPWLLLPLFYASRRRGVYAEYGHNLATDAFEDFLEYLPRGSESYHTAVQDLTLELYRQMSSPESRVFIDKTPRYFSIAREIMETFDEGKFIFLWRNPLAVVSSIVNSWRAGRWRLYRHKLDLYCGVDSLVTSWTLTDHRATMVRYEDLITDPDYNMAKLFQFLNLPSHPTAVKEFAQIQLRGRMGDSRGVESYSRVSREPLIKWKQTYCNPLRKAWARRYLEWISDERLGEMGYDMSAILNELAEVPTSLRRLGSDLFWMTIDQIAPWVEPYILRDKWRTRHTGRGPLVHT